MPNGKVRFIGSRDTHKVASHWDGWDHESLRVVVRPRPGHSESSEVGNLERFGDVDSAETGEGVSKNI